MEERYHATTQNQFYQDMSNVIKNITVEAKLISPPTYNLGPCSDTYIAVCINYQFIPQSYQLFKEMITLQGYKQ